MPHGLRNWVYKDVIKFLKAHGFLFSQELEGSHEAWINTNVEPPAIVDVDRKNSSHSYPPRTLESMIADSGLDKKAWREWASR